MADGGRFEHETELRFVVRAGAQELRAELARRAVGVTDETLTDTWFAPAAVQTVAEHRQWLRSAAAAPTRLRTARTVTGSSSRIEVKRDAGLDEPTASVETSLPVDDPVAATALLESLGLRSIAVVRKRRTEYRLAATAYCAVDEYDGQTVLEVERRTTVPGRDPRVELVRLSALAAELPGELTPLTGSPVLVLVEAQLAAGMPNIHAY